MQFKRPVNIDLMRLSFPPMAFASIFHRISGIILFLLFPLILFGLGLSLSDEEGFMQVQVLIASLWGRVVLWIFLSAWVYHVVAGIRHLLMDCGWGETLHLGRLSAWIVIFLGVLGVFSLGVYLW